MSTPTSRNGWRSRIRSGLRWPLRILIGLYLAFLLLVNVAINASFPWGFLRPADHSSSIGWGWGWSLLPAFATVHNFHLTIEDDNVQIGIGIDRAHVRYSPSAFLHKTFHATAVDAAGVSMRMRVKETAEQIAANGPEGLASLPTIPGFSDPPLRGPPSPPFQGDRSIYWTIQIDGVRADTQEIWIEDVRYLGSATAYGAFTFRPLTTVQVNAGLDLHRGGLTLSSNPLAQALRGSLQVTVDRFDPLPEVGMEPLKHISTELTLDGELGNVALLKPMFQGRAPDFESSSGHFDVYMRMDHGKFVPASRLELQASRWSMASGRYRAVGTDTLVEGSIEEGLGVSHGVVSISLGPYQVLDPDVGEELVEGDGMILRMMSDRLNLVDRPFEDLGFQVQFDAARLPDLTVLNTYLPKTQGFEVLGGTGQLTGAFLRPPDGIGSGDFQLDAHAAAVRVGGVELQGDLGLKARLSGLASSSKERSILGRSLLAGVAQLTSHFTVADMHARDDQSSHLLATFSSSAEVVLHPLLPSQVTGPELPHYLSGELKLDGVLPGLGFLDSTLQPRGFTISGGAGTLSVDARLTHGVLGRGTEVDFLSRDVQLAGGGVVGHGDLSLHGQVDETRATPSMTMVTDMKAAAIGTPSLPDFVHVATLALTASSPEVDLRDLARLRPTLELSGQAIVLRDLALLDRWLPDSIHLTHGRAEIGLTGKSPPEGSGSVAATFEVGALRGTAGPVSIAGQLTGEASLDGIAEEPWKAELLARSALSARAALDGYCHLVATSPEQARSTARLSFRAAARTPAIAGAQLTGQELAARTTGSVNLTGEVSNLAYLNHYLASTPVKVQGGSASVTGQIEVAHETVAPGSTVSVDTHGLQISLGRRLSLSGPLHITGTLGAADAADRAQIQAGMASFTLQNRFEDRVLAEGAAVSFSLRAPAFSSEGMLLDSTFHGRAERIAIPELGSLAAYFPDTKDFQLVSGSATATGVLEHPSRDHGEARLQIGVDGARLRLSGKPISADLRVGAVLRALATAGSDGKPLLQTLDVADTTFDLSNVDLPSGSPADRNWWAKVKVVRGELGFGDDSDSRVTFSADTAVEARDALPWLHLYGSAIGIPRWLDGLLAFNALKATAALELRGNRFALPAFQAEGHHLKLVGRLLLNDQHTSGDFLLEVGPFSLGVDVHDKHSGVQLLGAGGWYRERLAQPLE